MRKGILPAVAAASLAILFAACAGTGGDGLPSVAAAGSEAERLQSIFEDYFEEYLQLNPTFATYVGDDRYNDRFAVTISEEHRSRSLELQESYLRALARIDVGDLGEADRLSLEIFRRGREFEIESHRFPSHLLPVNQLFSMPNSFAQMGSGGGIHPFRTDKDYRDFLARVGGFEGWVDQAIANMRKGIERGIVQPRILMERTLPQLESQIVEDPEESLFYRPIRELPEGIGPEEGMRLAADYAAAIRDRIVPAYRRLRDFIRDEYLPATRTTVGLNELPDGEEWYRFRVRRITTTDLDPEEIHRIGLAEVARIRGEMRGVMREVGFAGSLEDFFAHLNEDDRFYFEEREDLLNGYRALRATVHGRALELFERFPEADYEIRAVEPFRERSSSGGSYRGPTPDGSRPGVFYVNSYDLGARPKWAMESLFLHEAVPGHHFQIALQTELDDLPRFRRFGRITAYSEGWGLYAESLGRDLGVYTDPYQYFGSLRAELWRALRLVVDTGLHAKGWTREQVLEYMYANSPVKEAMAVSEAERYIAMPAQALAYKIGQLKISELRGRAEEKLGDRFDVKAFHSLVLNAGPQPLDILESRVDRWIERQL